MPEPFDRSLPAVLQRMRALIADPSHWTRLHWARDGQGREVSPYAVEATCFCLVGAIMRSCCDQGELAGVVHQRDLSGSLIIWNDHPVRTHAQSTAYEETYAALRKTLKARRPDLSGSLIIWNDHPVRTHAEVLELVNCTLDGEKLESGACG